MAPPANPDDRGPKGGGRSRGKDKAGGRQGGGQRGQGQGGNRRAGRRDEPDNPVEQLRKPLEKVLARLPETQRKVLEMRMGLTDGHPHDLADTARELGLSMSEARDIEKRAFEHIREAVPLQQLQRFLGH
ncbi:MAG: hypothetical protein LC679_19085 [Intrasporangiaceae bacterium]|nr:hypothetical protein [Intrasporangiaceae bacterium]